MSTSTISHLEDQIEQLPLKQQLRLAERFLRRLRIKTADDGSDDFNDLASMAADVDVQRELRVLNQEFAFAEMDGLAPK